MSLLDELYKSVVLEHNKHPHNYGVLDPHDVALEGVNPSCGDELTLYLRFEGDVIDAAMDGTWRISLRRAISR